MTREKRSAHVQAKVFPSTRERLEKRVKGISNVKSMSDYLFELIERDLHEAETVSAVKQRIGGRVGRN